MIYKIALFIFFAFSFIINTVEASVIRDNGKVYIVNAVRAEGASFENEQSTKQIALEQARQKAFSDIIEYLKVEDFPLDDININTAISSYSIVDEYYNENFYSIIANFTFDKEIVKSLLKKKQHVSNGDIADYVVILKEKEDIIVEYMKLFKYLKKEKITSYPIKIESDKISVLIKQVNEDKIYLSLKGLDLNGKIYLN